jgi:hypothetical protein
MKLFDVDQQEQTLVPDDDIPLFDKTKAGDKLKGLKFN